MSDFSGKTVLITGAAGGIGQVLCRHFADHQAAIIALDQADLVIELAADLRSMGACAEAVVADISDRAQVRAAIAQGVDALGTVDILINNAAIAVAGTLAKTTAAIWNKEIAVDLNGAYYCVEAVIAPMQQNNNGAIVTISSVNALTALGNPAYSAAKAALISFTQSLALEYGRFGIRANVVCPGTVQTPAWKERMEQQPDIFEKLKKWYPLGRIAEPIDIAKAAAFLASDDARVITGSVLTVDAGLMAGNAVMAAELTLENF
jgi:NAD(P)-dependent dehydrogenase (short-subunit alcohol dehydrogenase family)